MSNSNPNHLNRLFSMPKLTVYIDGTTVLQYNYLPHTVGVFVNGRLLGPDAVDTSSGTHLTFTVQGGLRITDEVRIMNMTAYAATLINDTLPIGATYVWWNDVAPPPGYLFVRKTKLKKADYPALYSVLGDQFNDGTQASDEFMLPDPEGYFLRVLDKTGLVDPTVGRLVGSKQSDMTGSHTHAQNPTDRSISATQITAPAGAAAYAVTTGAAVQTGATGGAETRGKNMAINLVIKAVDGMRNPQLFDMGDYVASKPFFARIDQSNGWTRPQAVSSQALVDGSTVTWNMATTQFARLVPEGNRALTVTGAIPRCMYTLLVTQDAVGSRLIAWGSMFKFSGGIQPVLPSTPGAKSYFTFVENNGNLDCIGYALDPK